MSWLPEEVGPAEGEVAERQRKLASFFAKQRALNTGILFLGSEKPRLRLAWALLGWCMVLAAPALLAPGPATSDRWQLIVFLIMCTLLGFSCVHVAWERWQFHRLPIVRLLEHADDCDSVQAFIRYVFDWRPQLKFAVVSLAWSIALAACFLAWSLSVASVCLALWWVFSIGILIGNGVYWALVTPEFLRRIVASGAIALDPIAPAHTPGLRSLSSLLGTCAVMNAIVFTTMILGFEALTAVDPVVKSAVIAAHILVGGAVVVYSFVLPQLTLARAVWRQKARTQLALISELRSQSLASDQGSDRVDRVTEVLRKVRESPSTPIAAAVIWEYVTTAVLPLGTYIVAHRESLAGIARGLGF